MYVLYDPVWGQWFERLTTDDKSRQHARGTYEWHAARRFASYEEAAKFRDVYLAHDCGIGRFVMVNPVA